jgi:nicotinate-nucleotide pyrophosphorylase (carboxylating)
LKNSKSPNILLEASGGITIDSARAIAETGVDRIAVGGLVHRSHWLDIGLDAIDV